MNQMSFLGMDCYLKRRKTCREKFLEKMDMFIPWQRLVERIKSYCHNESQDGYKCSKPVYPLELMSCIQKKASPAWRTISEPVLGIFREQYERELS